MITHPITYEMMTNAHIHQKRNNQKRKTKQRKYENSRRRKTPDRPAMRIFFFGVLRGKAGEPARKASKHAAWDGQAHCNDGTQAQHMKMQIYAAHMYELYYTMRKFHLPINRSILDIPVYFPFLSVPAKYKTGFDRWNAHIPAIVISGSFS